MARRELPLPALDLAARASHAIALDPAGTFLHVSAVDVVDVAGESGRDDGRHDGHDDGRDEGRDDGRDDGRDEVAVRCAVTVRRPEHPDQRWWVLLRLGDDLEPGSGASPDALVAIVRALLDEWWHTKDVDPSVAAWGLPRT